MDIFTLRTVKKLATKMEELELRKIHIPIHCPCFLLIAPAGIVQIGEVVHAFPYAVIAYARSFHAHHDRRIPGDVFICVQSLVNKSTSGWKEWGCFLDQHVDLNHR